MTWTRREDPPSTGSTGGIPARVLALAAVSSLAVGGTACGRADDAPRCDPAAFDEATVTALLHRQRDAWNRGDLDAFMADYERSPELLFTSGAKIRRGFDETRDKYRARYGESPETMGSLDFEILDVRPLGECRQAAMVLGRWRLTETPEAGEGVFSVLVERQGEGWAIVHDHTSATPSE